MPMSRIQTRNLLKDGYQVTVWNRDETKCGPLKEAGAQVRQIAVPWACRSASTTLPLAQVASTAKDVAASCDVTFAMLSDPPAALAVALGENGIAAGADTITNRIHQSRIHQSRIHP
jgi:3-hydroxyisobutyrate dehydrogenase-like beta-hydroxyacid dehydrogenase